MVSEHAEVPGLLAGRRVIGEDGAVEEAEVRLGRVDNRMVRPDGVGQRARRRHQLRQRRGEQVEAQPGGRQDGVERAPIGDVGDDPPHPGHRDCEVERVRTGRHALETDMCHGPVGHGAGQVERAARRLDPATDQRAGGGDAAAFHQPAADRDGRVAAHGGVTLVMGEQHAGDGLRIGGADRDDTIHAGMAARLQHHGGAQPVETLARIAALGQHRRAGEIRIAAGDNAHRLAGGVHVRIGEFDASRHGSCPSCLTETGLAEPARGCNPLSPRP